MIQLLHGAYQHALQGIPTCDAVISDPPYSAHTHENKRTDIRKGIGYAAWTELDVVAFVEHWVDRCSGWICCITDEVLAPVYRSAFIESDRVTFPSVPLLAHQPRFSGDGPGAGAVYLVVSRPRDQRFAGWGSLPGWYTYVREQSSVGVMGAKPIDLMRAIVRDYSRPNDLIVDPCAGGATTLIAARIEGRRAIGSEMDAETYERALRRLQHGDHAARVPEQEALFAEENP